MPDDHRIVIEKDESTIAPDVSRQLFLHFNALSPILVVGLCLGVFDDIVVAVFAFQGLCLVLMPCLYLGTMPDGFMTYQVHLRQLLRNWKDQVKYAILAFVCCVFVGMLAFLIVEPIIPSNRVVKTAKEDGLNGEEFPTTSGVVFIALEFTFINSLLEELFWRVFLYREIGSLFRETSDGPTESSLLSGHDTDSEDSSSSLGSWWSSSFERSRILVSCYYSSYHVVVMLLFVPWYLAIFGFLGLVVLGRILVFCREHEVFGIVTGYGLHAGLDGAFCLIMLQMYKHWLR